MTGKHIKVEDRRPQKSDGSKEERMSAALEPRYENRKIYHYKGGIISVLEEELVMEHPPHDDVKDTLTMAITSSKIKYPHKPKGLDDDDEENEDTPATFARNHVGHGRFGGYR